MDVKLGFVQFFSLRREGDRQIVSFESLYFLTHDGEIRLENRFIGFDGHVTNFQPTAAHVFQQKGLGGTYALRTLPTVQWPIHLHNRPFNHWWRRRPPATSGKYKTEPHR